MNLVVLIGVLFSFNLTNFISNPMRVQQCWGVEEASSMQVIDNAINLFSW